MLEAKRDPLVRAFAIKGAALVVGLAAWASLSRPWNVVSLVAVAAGTVGFFLYTLAHPQSQYFVPVVHRADTRRRVVALTFDDGPDPVVTGQILDLLAAHGARASFFVVGERAARHPELVRRIHAEGHTLGTHTQHHRLRFHFGGAAYVRREIEDAIAVVARTVGRRPSLFRPPHGVRSPCFARGFQALRGLTCVTWTVRGLDARPTRADAIVARVEKHLNPGAIVALHDGTGLGGASDRRPTLAALARILERCRERSLACVTLDELMDEGTLVPGPGASDAERFPLKAVVPGVLYWPYRAFRTVGVASCFAAFWGGAVFMSWIGLPLLSLWPGAPLEKTRRALRAMRHGFDAFHWMMRSLALYHRTATCATARPGGQPVRSPVVLVANHPTLCDTTAIVSLFPNVVCLSNADYADNPFVGRALRSCGFVATGVHALAECQARLRQGFDVLIFPEGTRSPMDAGLQPFQRGAFEIALRAGVPIVLLKLTCRPPALSKALPIWRNPDRMPVLTVEPVETVIPDRGQRDSKALCRAVETRYHELLGLAPDSSRPHPAVQTPRSTASDT